MKVLIVLCLAAAASATSDPNLYVAPGVLPYVHHPYSTYTYPMVHPVLKTTEQKVDQVKPDQPEVSLKTNEYVSPFPYMGVHPYMYGHPLVKPVPKMVAKNGEVEHVVKRDADADPAVLYHAYSHGTPFYSGVVPSVASHVVSPYSFNYAHPYYYPNVAVRASTYANDRVDKQTPDYAGKGKYEAVNPGAIHVAKRDADAGITTTYSGVLPYATYPYTTYAGVAGVAGVPSVYRTYPAGVYNYPQIYY